MRDIIVIVGPTGVGKTKLSIELAKRLDGEIINGDSVSIFKRLNIASAKPTIEEREGIKHHLIDIKNIDEDYSVYDYQNDAREKIYEINSKNKRVIIVGGTGLYIKAALYNYKFTKGTTYNTYDNLSNEQLYSKIKTLDNNIEIHKNNRKRLVRVLNKLENNEEISNDKDNLLYPVKIIGLTTDRSILYERINQRVDNMIKNGLLGEIDSLKNSYKISRILNSAIGYKEFYDYLENNKSLEDVVKEIKKNSRHYAKRQYTFFNNQMKVAWFDVDFNNFERTIDKVIDYLN